MSYIFRKSGRRRASYPHCIDAVERNEPVWGGDSQLSRISEWEGGGELLLEREPAGIGGVRVLVATHLCKLLGVDLRERSAP